MELVMIPPVHYFHLRLAKIGTTPFSMGRPAVDVATLRDDAPVPRVGAGDDVLSMSDQKISTVETGTDDAPFPCDGKIDDVLSESDQKTSTVETGIDDVPVPRGGKSDDVLSMSDQKISTVEMGTDETTGQYHDGRSGGVLSARENETSTVVTEISDAAGHHGGVSGDVLLMSDGATRTQSAKFLLNDAAAVRLHATKWPPAQTLS
jgi:hypothetical protein